MEWSTGGPAMSASAELCRVGWAWWSTREFWPVLYLYAAALSTLFLQDGWAAYTMVLLGAPLWASIESEMARRGYDIECNGLEEKVYGAAAQGARTVA